MRRLSRAGLVWLDELGGEICPPEGLNESRQVMRYAIHLGVAGDEEHSECGTPSAHLSGELGAGHTGHKVVGYEQVEALVAIHKYWGCLGGVRLDSA